MVVFSGGLISIPVDILVGASLLQLCCSYRDRPVVILTNTSPSSDVQFVLQCVYFWYVLGVLLVFINVYFHPQSEAAAVWKGLGVVEIWKLYDRLLPIWHPLGCRRL